MPRRTATTRGALTCDARDCDVAIHAAVLGNDEFCSSWCAALADARVCIMVFTKPGQAQREANLVVAACSEAETAVGLAAQRAAVFVVTDTLDELLCSVLAFPGLQLIPPPSDDVSRRLVARWMAGRVQGSRHNAPAPVHLTDKLKVDFEQRSIVITDMGGSIALQYGEASLLQYLVVRRGAWTPTAQICSEVYNRTDEAAAKLAWKYISTLRKKFGDQAGLLETHRSYGYRLRPHDHQDATRADD